MKEKKEKKYEQIEVELPDKLFMDLALLAHEQNITFNQLCEKIIKESLGDERFVKNI